MIPLAAFEEIIDASGVAPQIEAMLPIGVRHRQLRVRTLLAGMMLSQADQRPAHLTRVRDALIALPEPDQLRLGVIEDWTDGPHLLTYRQIERTFGLVARALGDDHPDGLPAARLQRICDALLEASIPDEFTHASTSLAVDWTDLESFSRPPPAKGGDCADLEASWGHRKNNLLRSEDELFFGYYFSAGIMMPKENGPAVPELARRATVSSCRHDPVRVLVPVLTAMPAAGIPPGDVLADSGYAHRDPDAWALPLRAAGASLVQDLHPHDRGPKGTHHGAIITSGNLYCPATPRSLLELGPLSRDTSPEQAAAHDTQTAELARYKLGRLTRDDQDGYHRVACPAVMGKIRCPLRPSSMTLDRDRPEILTPPEHPPACCTRQTLTAPPDVLAKTAQKHDYPSKAHRRSYARRTGAERGFATAKDPATNDISCFAHRPQPAHPARLERPAGRKRTPRRQRPAPENPPPPAQDPHRAHHPHQAAIDAGTSSADAASTPVQARRARPATPKPGHAASRHTERHQPTTVRNTGRMSDPAAKITKAQT